MSAELLPFPKSPMNEAAAERVKKGKRHVEHGLAAVEEALTEIARSDRPMSIKPRRSQ